MQGLQRGFDALDAVVVRTDEAVVGVDGPDAGPWHGPRARHSTSWGGGTLDAKARARDIAGKTAFNIWSVWTTAAKAAAGQWKKDKSRKLRTREDNPCAGVAAPDRDGDKELQWLYPVEFITLVACEALPLEFRRLYALATYLFLRGGELKALMWPDVDIERGILSVRRSYERQTGRLKQTKTGNKGIRRFAIEPALLPLLQAMHADAGGQGAVVVMRQQKWWAADLRKHVEAAGIEREALFSTDDTRKRLRFHDLLGTGLTWLAIRGDDPLKIQQRAGHRTFEMTQKYIRTAEAVGEVIGDTFPPLPECPVAGRYRQSNRPSDLQLLESTVDTIASNSNRRDGRAGVRHVHELAAIDQRRFRDTGPRNTMVSTTSTRRGSGSPRRWSASGHTGSFVLDEAGNQSAPFDFLLSGAMRARAATSPRVVRQQTHGGALPLWPTSRAELVENVGTF
ncbi:MAG: tyrosine-type recombinase/integrase [Deltaproteobacteria bacterium]